MISEINRLKTEYVSNVELQEAKDKILGNILISLETNMDDASLLSWYGALGYDINHLEDYKKAILDVTQSDVLAAANKYFSKAYINVTVRSGQNTALPAQAAQKPAEKQMQEAAKKPAAELQKTK